MPENKPQPNLDLKQYIVEVITALYAARNELNQPNNLKSNKELIFLPRSIDFDISLSVIQSDGSAGKLAVTAGLFNVAGSVGSDDFLNSSGRVKFTIFLHQEK